MSDRAYVATRKGLFTIDRHGGSWQIGSTAFLGDNVSMLLRDARDGALYAGLAHGHFGAKLHRSDDDGRTWIEIGAPAYPPKPEGLQDVAPMSGKEVPWSTQQLWALEPGGKDEPGVLWCGTIPGGLFRSSDRGATWRLVESLWRSDARRNWFGGGYDFAGIHSICVDPRNSRKVTVGVSVGGVWRTEDGGETWRVCSHGMRAEYMPPDQQLDPHMQDPHLIVQCRARPDCYWSQHHNGVFRTTDDCAAWKEIAPAVSAFGFAVAVHPRDPNCAWLVPGIKDEKRIPLGGRVVVTRTRDGGATFDTLHRGLPQEHAYDIVFRHGLDVDESGSRLILGSTTGGLWVSEDAGDSWQAISAHLPPVYCARFAKPD